jgi:hypothetical protein
MTVRIFLTVSMLAVVGCAASKPVVGPQCDWESFEPAPYDHIIEGIEGVKSLSSFAGRFTLSPLSVEGGGWPPATVARIEIHGPNGLKEFVIVSGDGRFSRPGFPEGMYCFKVSLDGFRTVTGDFVIDHDANSDSIIEIEFIISVLPGFLWVA